MDRRLEARGRELGSVLMLLVAAAADAVVDCWTRQAAAWHAGSSLPPGLSAQGGYLVKYEVEPDLFVRQEH